MDEDLSFPYLLGEVQPDYWTLDALRHGHPKELSVRGGMGAAACGDRLDAGGLQCFAEPEGPDGASCGPIASGLGDGDGHAIGTMPTSSSA